MDESRSPCSPSLRAVVVAGLLCLLPVGCASKAAAQSAAIPERVDSKKPSNILDVRTCHFLLHTDLARDQADALAEQLETMLGQLAHYWGRPLRGVIECYVIQDLDAFPLANVAPDGVSGMKTAGGIALMRFDQQGERRIARAVVYASARPEVVRHEVIHAYCHQTFGCIGPIWYSEGMAELGHYWKKDDYAVLVDPRELDFLRDHPPSSLAATLSPSQVSGDCWQNYASRWALCHFLTFNPNYRHQFRKLGRGFVAGKDVSFERTFAGVMRPLFFEYRFFLEHISRGYRVDLCAWDWSKKFTCLQPGRTFAVTIVAGRGWQPTGLTLRQGIPCEFAVEGTWRIAGTAEDVDADGDKEGRGRLVGVLLKDDRLGAEFELGVKGTLPIDGDGDLYLRCRKPWNELADDAGEVAVKFQLAGSSNAPRDDDDPRPSAKQAACRTAPRERQ